MSDKDRIENAIRHIQTATDVDPWAMEIAVKAMKAQLSEEGTTKGTTFDLISRQEAMDAFASLLPYVIDDAVTEAYAHGLSDGYAVICNLPSAQSEIIRCKDCKYQDENWRRVSVKWLPCMDMRTGSNWYCGSAERRTE